MHRTISLGLNQRNVFRVKILVTGANGFIGRYLASALLHAGHEVVPAVRRPQDLNRFLQGQAAIAVNFNHDTEPNVWLSRLAGIDAVINCVGILQGGAGQNIEAIHHTSPRALFRACEMAGINRVVQISAISAVDEAGTEYAISKMHADEFLKTTTLDWIILKPSLVYAPGAYGGTALLRGLAALPFVVPIVGDGRQTFRPLSMDDLCATVVSLLDQRLENRTTLVLVGPEEVTLEQIIVDLRSWLGFSAARLLHIPKSLVRMLARLGDAIGGTINTTAFQQMEFGNSGTAMAHDEQLRTTATAWHDGLRKHPSQVQDRWHARLYFLRPVLRAGLGITWILSGLIGFLQPYERVEEILAKLGLPSETAFAAFVGTCTLDIAIGLALLLSWRPALVTSVQITTVLSYTLALSIAVPTLWSDPFGPLLKNLVFLIAVLIHAAIERDR